MKKKIWNMLLNQAKDIFITRPLRWPYILMVYIDIMLVMGFYCGDTSAIVVGIFFGIHEILKNKSKVYNFFLNLLFLYRILMIIIIYKWIYNKEKNKEFCSNKKNAFLLSSLFLFLLFIFLKIQKYLSWIIGIYVIIAMLYYIFNIRDLNVKSNYSFKLSKNFNTLDNEIIIMKLFFIVIFSLVKVFFLVEILGDSLVYNVLILINLMILLYNFISKLIFEMTGIPPIILIPLLCLLIIGRLDLIILNWTFIAIILINIVINFFNLDIKYLLSEEKLEMVKNNEEEYEKRIFEFRYTVLLGIPVVYLIFFIFEQISSKSLIYYIIYDNGDNYLFFGRIFYLFISILFCLPVIVFFLRKKEQILTWISNKIFFKDMVISEGKYTRVDDKEEKKWKSYENDNYEFHGNRLCKKNEVWENYKIEGNKLKIGKDEKEFKLITENIILIENNCYMRDQYIIEKNFNNAPKETGDVILNKINSGFWVLLIISLAIFLGINVGDSYVKDRIKGEYVKVEMSLDKNKTEEIGFSSTDKIDFKEETITRGNETYKIDKQKLTFTDLYGEPKGDYNNKNEVNFKDENGDIKEKYIKKDSEVYNMKLKKFEKK